MNIAEVIIANHSKAVDRAFHYIAPEGMNLSVGQRVLIPFGRGNRAMSGLIVGFTDESKFENLKSIIRPIDERPLLTKQLVELAGWMQKRYICTFYKALKTIMPAGAAVKTTKWVTLIKNEEVKANSQKAVIEMLESIGGTADFAILSDIPRASSAINALAAKGIVSVDESVTQAINKKVVRMVAATSSADVSAVGSNAPRQIKMLEILQQTGAISVSDLVAFSGGSYSAVKALCEKGLVFFEDKVVYRNAYDKSDYKKTRPLKPTKEQKKVIEGLKAAFDKKDITPSLIRGVTGSGKTEVFLQVIDYIISKGAQAIVLVPEISLTPQMTERFVGRFGSLVSVMHSGLSLGERYDEWQKVLKGDVKVAVGARSAVFAPFDNLGIIIIDEEHEGTYKSENSPNYHVREIALQRSKNEGALVVMSSATPLVTTYCNAKRGRYTLFEIKNRYNLSDMPQVEIVDMRRELELGNKTVFGNKLLALLEENIKNKQQAILFHNRRGFNSFVMCRSCGEVLVCDNCSISLTYHKYGGRLKCHYCGFERKNVSQCPSCNSPYIRYMGMGTEKIEEDIKSLFGENSFIRMDGDTTSGKNSHEIILRRFERENIPILLGTQMVTKGLDFPNVTLVGVMLADLSLNTDDYRAAERTFSQLTQVCGRAGRGELSGRAVIQTYQPKHYALRLAKEHNYEEFYAHEIAVRKQLIFPPFCDIIMLLMQGEDESKIINELTLIAGKLRGRCLSLLGPVPAPYVKIKNKFRWRVLLKSRNTSELLPLLHSIMKEHSNGENHLTIDINPNSMN
ncbi:MAG: primosomal protein N' [Firmicutes bacterium]|nr:primosomal protein N' [Bacillota bacterium]